MKRLGQCSLILTDGHTSVSGGDDDQPPGRRELGGRGRVNLGESLINRRAVAQSATIADWVVSGRDIRRPFAGGEEGAVMFTPQASEVRSSMSELGA